MSAVNIIQIQHPSGKLFDDYCRFVEDHPDVTYFQSDAFIRFIDDWPHADWILLLIVRKEGLKDPGARPASYRPGDIFNIPSDKPIDKAPKAYPEVVAEEGKIAGSLLAVNIWDEVPASAWLRPFAWIYRMLTTRTIVYGGPLLGEATRLQKELRTKTLLNALHKLFQRRSVFTQFQNSFDLTDFLPLFREMGYRFFGYQIPGNLPEELTFQGSIARAAQKDDSIPGYMQENTTATDRQVNNMHSNFENQKCDHGCFLRVNHAVRYYLLNTGYKLFRLFKSKR